MELPNTMTRTTKKKPKMKPYSLLITTTYVRVKAKNKQEAKKKALKMLRFDKVEESSVTPKKRKKSRRR